MRDTTPGPSPAESARSTADCSTTISGVNRMADSQVRTSSSLGLRTRFVEADSRRDPPHPPSSRADSKERSEKADSNPTRCPNQADKKSDSNAQRTAHHLRTCGSKDRPQVGAGNRG